VRALYSTRGPASSMFRPPGSGAGSARAAYPELLSPTGHGAWSAAKAHGPAGRAHRRAPQRCMRLCDSHPAAPPPVRSSASSRTRGGYPAQSGAGRGEYGGACLAPRQPAWRASSPVQWHAVRRLRLAAPSRSSQGLRPPDRCSGIRVAGASSACEPLLWLASMLPVHSFCGGLRIHAVVCVALGAVLSRPSSAPTCPMLCARLWFILCRPARRQELHTGAVTREIPRSMARCRTRDYRLPSDLWYGKCSFYAKCRPVYAARPGS
jgi:hypothetical protein